MRRRFALLDRDGTLIAERHYLARPDGVELLPGADEGLRQLAGLGVGLAVVSNQSGLSRGYFDWAALDAIHERLRELLARGGVRLDGLYVCPHTDEHNCGCRKPRPGLVRQAAAELDFDPADAFVLGDKACDVDLGRAVGATTFLVRTGYGGRMPAEVRARADFVVDSVRQAAEVISTIMTGQSRRALT
ncbi:MAG: HAD family hydrolase, partial [Gemmataceae bacterium]|nr:HAD family hydrolase [Gemmataceae bacterium]